MKNLKNIQIDENEEEFADILCKDIQKAMNSYLRIEETVSFCAFKDEDFFRLKKKHRNLNSGVFLNILVRNQSLHVVSSPGKLNLLTRLR